MELIANHKGSGFYKEIMRPSKATLDHLRVPNVKSIAFCGNRKIYITHQLLQKFGVESPIDKTTRIISDTAKQEIQNLFDTEKDFKVIPRVPYFKDYISGTVSNVYFKDNAIYGTIEILVKGRLFQYDEHFTIKPIFLVSSVDPNIQTVFSFRGFGVSQSCADELINSVPSIKEKTMYFFDTEIAKEASVLLEQSKPETVADLVLKKLSEN